MNRQFWLGVFAVAVVLFVLWGPLRALLFGGSLGSGASGEWVGTMTITEGYPYPPVADFDHRPLATPLKAAVYLKLAISDGFMHEYSGPGELHIQGDTSPIPCRLGAFRIHPPEAHAKGAFGSQGFVDDGIKGSFSPGTIQFEHTAWPTQGHNRVAFSVELHHGTKADYQDLWRFLSSAKH